MNRLVRKGKNIDQLAPKPQEMTFIPSIIFCGVGLMLIQKVGELFGYDDTLYRMFAWIPVEVGRWLYLNL